MFSKVLSIKKWRWVIIIGCIVLAFFLRFWNLGTIPEGFYVDEASVGYNAYSLMQTHRDEYGAFMPLIMRGFNDYRSAINSYLTIPFIYGAGLTEWSVRAPTALFGVIFILLTYALVYRISKKRALALISMALATISPVGILLSRSQSVLVSFVIFYAAVYVWLLWVEKRALRYLGLALAGVIVSFYAYSGIQLVALPFLLLIIAWHWHAFQKRLKIMVSVFFLIICLFVAVLFFSSAGTRFSQVSVFSTMNVQLPLNEEIREDGAQHQAMLVTRMLHNKVTAYGGFLLKNFTDYLSFRFLFLQASQPVREQIPNMGVLLLIECPFLLVGIYTAIRKKLSYGILCILWFLLVPTVLSVASEETPNIHRFFLAMIPIHVLVALGILTAVQTATRRYRAALCLGISVLFTINVFYFLHELFVHQPVHNPIYRNAPDKELALYLKSIYSSYDVIVSQKILEDILFYWPIEPSVYQKEGSPRDYDNARYNKFLFVTDACPSDMRSVAVRAVSGKRILYVDKGECSLAATDKLIKTIRFGNTLDAYYLVEKIPMGK